MTDGDSVTWSVRPTSEYVNYMWVRMSRLIGSDGGSLLSWNRLWIDNKSITWSGVD